MEAKRLYFIDAVRAFAILMMLQGHFIDTLLHPIYRDESNVYYNLWSYLRGITAPVFFTVSGLVFAYLLLRAYEKGNDRERIKKGIFRGLLLIVVGYSLRINVFNWITGYFTYQILVIDVLQCIGIAIFLLILLHELLKKYSYFHTVVLLAISCLCFITEPLYRNISLENIPLFYANYFTKAHGSIFTILPWFGYSAFGAFISTIFFRHAHKNQFKWVTILTFFVIGFLLIYSSTPILLLLYKISHIQLFKMSALYNYLFTRLGNVLILFGLFYAFEQFLKQPLILNIGKKTLSIYVIHFIFLYGSFTGYGLKRYFNKSLEPTQLLLGVILFITVVCFIAFHYAKTNHFIYLLTKKITCRIKKITKP
ncbi:DUF1624 domain-containing protein [Seonamhaeicola sp. NFXS20]|uniref:heparan-alpha-glucosaminide N-acetyltransferase domain-containing protein n=1 Tax=unclassified Seonamhaeicola TaxID=2622645 RepID=UPI0035684972